MSYTVLSIDPEGYAASATLAQAAMKHLEKAGHTALAAMSGLAHMGGNDTTGGQFAHLYDKRAATIFGRLSELSTALSVVSATFGASAVSHASAESANSTGVTGAAGTIPDPMPAVVVEFSNPASAYGGTNAVPQGWVFIQELVSATWPDGDTGKMRQGEAAWNALADDIDYANSWYISTLLDPLQGFQAPDISAITSKTSVLGPAASELIAECRTVASICGTYAKTVDQAHQDAGTELAEFVLTSAAAIGISLLLTPLTAGVSDLVGGAAVAADAAVTAGEVSETLGTMVARVAPLLVKLGEVSRTGSAGMQFAAKTGIFLGKTAAVGTIWAAGGVYGDAAVHGGVPTDAGEDLESAFIGGAFGGAGAEAGKMLAKDFVEHFAGEASGDAAQSGARLAGDAASGDPAADTAPLDGPRHRSTTPTIVKVGANGIKTIGGVTGNTAGTVANQLLNGGVDPTKLPSDAARDNLEGLLPILEPGGLHAAR